MGISAAKKAQLRIRPTRPDPLFNRANWWITSPKRATPCPGWLHGLIQRWGRSGLPTPSFHRMPRRCPPACRCPSRFITGLCGERPIRIIPDAVYVNGPDAASFNIAQFINQQGGWLYKYDAWAFSGTRTAAEIVEYVANNYSVSPKLLLALLEYQAGVFSNGSISDDIEAQIMGIDSPYRIGVYLQLARTADTLNDAYYRWREGDLIEFELADGSIVRPDPLAKRSDSGPGSFSLRRFWMLRPIMRRSGRMVLPRPTSDSLAIPGAWNRISPVR